jgi:hypothetical protein
MIPTRILGTAFLMRQAEKSGTKEKSGKIMSQRLEGCRSRIAASSTYTRPATREMIPEDTEAIFPQLSLSNPLIHSFLRSFSKKAHVPHTILPRSKSLSWWPSIDHEIDA